MLKSWKRFHNIESFRALFQVMTPRDTERVAVIPLLLFVLSPVLAMILRLIDPDSTYQMVTNPIQTLTVAAGILTLICCIGMQAVRGHSAEDIFYDHTAKVCFLLFAILMLVSVAANGFTELGIHGDSYRRESLLTFMSYGLFYYGCAAMIVSEGVKRMLCRVLVYSSWCITVPALLDRYGVLQIKQFHDMRQEAGTLTANFFQYNHYAYYLMMVIMVSLGLFLFEEKRVWRVAALVTMTAQTFTLVTNRTRGCLLACLVMLGLTWVVLRMTGKKAGKRLAAATAAFVIAAVIGYLLSPENWQRIVKTVDEAYNLAAQNENAKYAGAGRGLLWKLTVKYISEKPLLGWGTEGIRDRMVIESGHLNNRPHNEYLEYAAFFGIPACIAYLSAVLSVFVRAIRQRKLLSVMSITALIAAGTYLMSAFFGNTMFYTAPFLFIFMGLGFRSDLPEKPAEQTNQPEASEPAAQSE